MGIISINPIVRPLLRPRLRFPDVEQWVASIIDPLTKRNVQEKAKYLSFLLDRSFFLDRKHKNPLTYGFDFRDSDELELFLFSQSFSSRALRGHLGGSRADYKKFLTPFWTFNTFNAGYSRKKKITKAYVLNDTTLAKLYDIWGENASADVVDEDTNRLLTKADFPSNGVLRTSNPNSGISIRSIIPIELGKIDAMIAQEVGAQKDKYGSGLPLHLRRPRVQALRYLFEARQWIRVIGGVPNLYSDYAGDTPTERNGRLWGLGGFHLQRLRKAARKILYEGTGWWDFDFEACHLSILQSLARAHKLEVPWFDDFMADRAKINEDIAADIGVRVGRMKVVMNALIYGQEPSTNPHKSLLATVGSLKATKKLIKHLYYRMVKIDVEEVIAPVVVASYIFAGMVVNAVGKERPILLQSRRSTGSMEKEKEAKLLSHIVTGFEAWALNLICSNTSDLVALMHDGFVSEQGRDVGALEEMIEKESKREFGFPIKLRLKEHQYL